MTNSEFLRNFGHFISISVCRLTSPIFDGFENLGYSGNGVCILAIYPTSTVMASHEFWLRELSVLSVSCVSYRYIAVNMQDVMSAPSTND